MEGRAPAREGYRVFRAGKDVGEVRSGSVAPALGNRSIATALLAKDAATVGSELEVEIRGGKHAATVVQMPFYKRAS
jgi:aminomethyltransferase